MGKKDFYTQRKTKPSTKQCDVFLASLPPFTVSFPNNFEIEISEKNVIWLLAQVGLYGKTTLSKVLSARLLAFSLHLHSRPWALFFP